MTQLFVAEYFAAGRLAGLRRLAGRDLPRAARRDARGAADALPARGGVDAAAGRPVHLGDAARLHRHDRPARARAATRTSRSCPGARRTSTAAAAPRCGSTSPAPTRRRSARACGGSARSSREQVALYGTLTGAAPAAPRASTSATPGASPSSSPTCWSCRGADRARRAESRPVSRSREHGRGPPGRPLAGAAGVAEVGRARRGRAAAARPHGGRDRRRRGSRRAADASSRPDAAFVALHGRDGEDGTIQELLEVLGHPVHRLGRGGVHPLLGQGADEAPAARRRASRRPTSTPSARRRSASSARRRRCRRSSSSSTFPLVVKPAAQGSALGIKFARAAARRAGGDRLGLLLRPQGAARALRRGARPGGLDRRARTARRGAAGRRGGAGGARLLRLRGALRDRAHALRVPGGAAGRGGGARPRSWRSRPTGRWAAPASRGST